MATLEESQRERSVAKKGGGWEGVSNDLGSVSRRKAKGKMVVAPPQMAGKYVLNHGETLFISSSASDLCVFREMEQTRLSFPRLWLACLIRQKKLGL